IKQDGQLFTTFNFAPFCSQIRREGGKEAEEKRLSQLLLTALEPSIVLDSFPRGKYTIVVTILDIGTELGDQLSNMSSCLSAGITCATLALVNSCVQMYDLALGIDIDISSLSSTSNGEKKTSSVALLTQLRQVSMFNAEGLELKSAQTLPKLFHDAFQQADRLYATIRSSLLGMCNEHKTT
ncbi:unnamed protein product, partial [Rodentolepis nana]|uniref:RNase_PH domain-containing protein n=1 Tax=Rodentolepis nana TaxID=102285 RepID=A0A0R3T872_RODNA